MILTLRSSLMSCDICKYEGHTLREMLEWYKREVRNKPTVKNISNDHEKAAMMRQLRDLQNKLKR
jgi:hypothetical protein